MSDYALYYEMKEFLAEITRADTDFNADTLFFDDLSVDSIAYFELLFFIKSRLDNGMTADQLSLRLMEIVAEQENIDFSDEEKRVLLGAKDHSHPKTVEIKTNSRVRHIAMLLGCEIPSDEQSVNPVSVGDDSASVPVGAHSTSASAGVDSAFVPVGADSSVS
jgi:acyl carrier protein